MSVALAVLGLGLFLIFEAEAEAAADGAPVVVATEATMPRLVDLNAATASELLQLPHIGKKRAEAILAYRATRPFRRPSDLLRIKGIGKRRFAKIAPLVTVGPPAPAATN